MRLLFVENRYTTWLYAGVARALAAEGHDIHWMVQNPRFAPTLGTLHRLAFPSRGDLSPGEGAYRWLARTDRGILHFGGTDAHYPAYDARIQRLLADLEPEVVFGESTQFHELLTLNRCRDMGIPYLSPTSTRYPSGRMCFFAYDSLVPVGGCGEDLQEDEALALLRAIRSRQVVPSYMRVLRPSWRERLRHRGEALRILAGWIAGERYITPSPWRKFRLQRRQREAAARWDRMVRPGPLALPEGPWALYPLQMQPEANIDVWGRPWNDQADIIRRAAASLSSIGGTLVVKPNPKSKYEMDQRLCDLVASLPNVLPLPHAAPMGEVFPAAPLVLTVTGTVLLESVFAGKPVAVLGDHAMSRFPGVVRLASPEALGQAVADAQAGRLRTADAAEALQVLRFLHRTSYPAEYFNPLAHLDKLAPEALAPLVQAFRDVLGRPSASLVSPEGFQAAPGHNHV